MRASMVRPAMSPISYLLLAAALALGGCATGPAACAPDERSTVSDMLYFGLATPTGGRFDQEAVLRVRSRACVSL